MTRQEYILSFLRTLKSRIPPAPGKHHAITFTPYYSDADGWQDRLQLLVNNNGCVISLFLYSLDFEKEVSELVQDIERLVASVTVDIVETGEKS